MKNCSWKVLFYNGAVSLVKNQDRKFSDTRALTTKIGKTGE